MCLPQTLVEKVQAERERGRVGGGHTISWQLDVVPLVDERNALLAEVERLRDNAEARERVMRREGDLLRAAQREVDELRGIYAALRQTSGDLCVVCGWRFFVPGEGCQGCEVERLRADNERYGSQLEAAHDRGVAEERAAVVAYLRRKATDDFCALRVKEACDAEKSADAIERGEHRREEER